MVSSYLKRNLRSIAEAGADIAAEKRAEPTPGPWEDRGMGIVSARVPQTHQGEGFTVSTELTLVCYCGDCGNGLAQNWEANARLIAAAPDTAAERDRLKAENAELLEALREVVSAHEYTTPAGTINCRFCDNCMDHEGTFEDMHDENCVISKARAVLTKAQEPTPARENAASAAETGPADIDLERHKKRISNGTWATYGTNADIEEFIAAVEALRERARAKDEALPKLLDVLETVAPYFEGEHHYDHPDNVRIRAARKALEKIDALQPAEEDALCDGCGKYLAEGINLCPGCQAYQEHQS